MNKKGASWARGTAFVVALGGTASVYPAHAYVRTRASESAVLLAWRKPCINLQFLLGSRPEGVSEELFRTAVGESAAQWSSSRLACTKMFLSVSASPSAKTFVDADRVNTVQFRSDFWGRNASKPADVVPYPFNALAITSVFADRKTGAIVDTDVEINATGPMWGDVVANPELRKSSNSHDLQNTLTHEFGHVIGLDHTCDGGGQSNLKDNAGRDVPRCPGNIDTQETTMAAIVTPGDTVRRTLAPDDQKGICEIYPADGKLACSDGGGDGGGGCLMAKGSRSRNGFAMTALSTLAAALLVWKSRRRGASERS